MNDISVIVCTHNPDPGILVNCLQGIQRGHNRYPIKEILVVDNNSDPPLQELGLIQLFINQISNARIIVEFRQGLTFARLTGISQSTGGLLVFIDDDNIIRDDYFFMADRLSREFPFIGAFSGQVQLSYFEEPPEWTKKYWGMLVHRLFVGNKWGNLYFENSIMPNGAGLCIKREVAQYYQVLHESGQRFIILDRSAGLLLSGGDNDLAMCACDIGLGMGLFDSLYLEHLIPPSRFTKDYLTRLTEGIYYSAVLLRHMRLFPQETISLKRKLWDFCRAWIMKEEDVAILKAMNRGRKEAYALLKLQSKRLE